MKTRGFYNLEQAQSYLSGSIIRVANHPVNIVRVDSGNRGRSNFKLTYTKIDDPFRKEFSILSDADEVDMNPMEMGMLSIKPGSSLGTYTYYAERIPWRAYKVGANRNNTVFLPVVDRKNSFIDNHIMFSAEFADTVKGRFLSLKEAIAACDKVKKGCFPFSRRWAVDYNRNVYFKKYGVPVGKVDGGEVVLSDKAFFLKEVLQEDLNGR